MSRIIKTGGFVSERLIRLSPVARYGIAILAAEAAAILYLALDPVSDEKIPYLLFYPAVMISAWVGGLWPGVTTVAAAIGADYLWLRPDSIPPDLGGMILFILVGVVMSALNGPWRNAALAIAQSEERLRVTLTSIGDAVITTDDRGIVTHLNTVAEDLTGWTETRAVGRPLQRVFFIINEQTQQQAQNPVARVLKERVTCAVSSNILLVSKSGEKIPIEMSAAPIRAADGRNAGVVMVFRDVTVRRVVERERATLHERERTARRQAEEANRARDEFLAMLSHELRNPLSSILGWTAILKSKDLSAARASHAVEVIERNARVEAQLVESLLDLSRIISGKLKLAMEPLDLSSVLTAAVDSARPTADAKGVILDLQAVAGPIAIIGDSARMQQIFSNLLSNAIKFTPPEGHVRVELSRQGAESLIRVIDDGEGISSEFLPHIFDRFRQADSATDPGYGGLGLGLAIVEELVHAHGGTIAASSLGKGQGSTFTVTLPVSAAVRAANETSTGAAAGVEASVSKLRVLVVDDDTDTRELIGSTLESHGAVVRQASTAGEAVASIQHEQPDVLIADIGMPEEDGYALIRKLRMAEREHQKRHLPAIALTAYASPADREEALNAGYDLHLAKPIQQQELALAVAKAFHDHGRHALYRQTHQ